MKISLPINQFFDDTGFPLVAGRVSIFTHDSDTICKVFTLSGDIYSEAVNPIITTEDGRIPTLFFDATVVDVKVEKANGDGSYELLDTFQAGFNVPDATNDTVVNGLDALKGTNPEVGVVSVYGYDKNAVAPMRHYVWDPTCTDAADERTCTDKENCFNITRTQKCDYNECEEENKRSTEVLHYK